MSKGRVAGDVVAFGDRAVRFALPAWIERRTLLAALRDAPGVVDVVLAEDTGAVLTADPTSLTALAEHIARLLSPAPAARAAPAPAPVRHVVRVVYDGDDIAAIAALAGLPAADVIALHAAGDYEVAMLGFLPGFAYLRGLHARLVVPRRAQPRPRVPACSVAIAAEYTGIYPFSSPGGWNLLGRAVDYAAFDAQGAAFAIGDRVRFEPVAGSSRGVGSSDERRSGGATTERFGPTAQPGLEVRKAQGLALVVDGGRVGHMHEGVPHGGPMVPEALVSANAAVGNAAGTAAIEVYGRLEVVAFGGHVSAAVDGGAPQVLAEGEALAVATDGRARVRYVAVRGGVDVPIVLGGRGTLLVAGLGGFEGRALRRGDRVPTADASVDASAHAHVSVDARADVAILAGPDVDDALLAAIMRATFTISAQSDRIGTRLEGPSLPAHPMQSAHDRRSLPMVRGAIEVTPSGLVVLGPDHPTTGGYPVVAVVSSTSLGSLMARPIGARVRLVVYARPPA